MLEQLIISGSSSGKRWRDHVHISLVSQTPNTNAEVQAGCGADCSLVSRLTTR